MDMTYEKYQQMFGLFSKDRQNNCVKCSNKKELEDIMNKWCYQINADIENHIKNGFERMLLNPRFNKFISDLKCTIKDGCGLIEITTQVIPGSWSYYRGDNLYEPVELICNGVRPSQYGLPTKFEHKFDFWAFVLGLTKHLNYKSLNFFVNTSPYEFEHNELLEKLIDHYSYHVEISNSSSSYEYIAYTSPLIRSPLYGKLKNKEFKTGYPFLTIYGSFLDMQVGLSIKGKLYISAHNNITQSLQNKDIKKETVSWYK